jgi:hypothetical protein
VIATYRLLRQTSRWCRFAIVTVAVAPAAAQSVSVADDVDGWVEHRREAVAGARHALGRLPAGSGDYGVTVTGIRATAVDTGVGDVHEAAARAVWQAVGVAPRPVYVGFHEPEVVAAWLRDRIGLRLVAVTEARYWFRGQRDRDAASLVHAWLHFDHRPPTRLHGRGDDLLLSTGDPYPDQGMDEAGDIRVGPAAVPDLLAGIVGRRLTDAATILGPSRDRSCAGLRLRLGDVDLMIGSHCDEWVLTDGQLPMWIKPDWRVQPWLARESR